jgi:hypothetical protein
MELASLYLFTLATVSITFAGFAALTVILRQMLGSRLTEFDIFFVRTVLIRGFVVAGCALLPVLLALLELPNINIWRTSSLITAIVQGVFLGTWARRRRKATSVPVSKWSLANHIGQWVTAIYLLATATGIFLRATAGTFAAGLTAFMLFGFVAYLIAIQVLLLVDPKEKKHGETKS